ALRAVATKDGNIVDTVEVSTTGGASGIVLSAERKNIAADRRDVAHIVAEIRDEQGRMAPIAENEITFDIQGEGKLIGVDNGNPQSHESYKTNRRKVFNGLCLAIVQSTARAGQIRISASSPTLRADSLDDRHASVGQGVATR
ncbi:beta-galactosidase, partial [mine drainage metagenome]